MPRLLALLLTALLAGLGLVAVSPVPAQAVCGSYVTCISTKTTISAPNSIEAGSKLTVKVKVTTRGEGRPEGTVTVTVAGGDGYRKTVTKSYGGGSESFNFGKIKKPGKYKITAKFTTGPSSIWRDSKEADALKVTKK